VVRAADVAGVQAAVREGVPLVPSGLGAHLDIGGPTRADVLLRLDLLNRVLDHQAADMTVTVEAGCPLTTLAEALAAAGQWLPLDPPRPEGTTVGGLLAANLSGPLRASQGTARDLLIGIRVVAADGALVSGGGKVVKNVAGYDLPKMHVGALGTLGVIVEATFKVRPRPEREEAVVIACRTAEQAAEAAQDALESAVPPLWLEVAGAGGLGDGPGDGAAVAIGLGGTPEEVAHGRELMLASARARNLRAVPVPDGAALRVRLGAFAVEPAAAVLRLAMLPAEVGPVLAGVERVAREQGAAIRILAHAANGVARVAIADPARVPTLVRALRPAREAAGGSLVVERAPDAVKADLDVWGDPGPGFALMCRLKDAFDPARILSPGRFVGGL
jgi:glycolate oxidase FAD binding subunit